ncbi:DMT family transporter [Salipiger abyssi]|uniref:DMT family transporter n=1 Tax=Salipiger abyssi TaxID=1250539 RepID=UPI001A8E5B29|nr:DMT family transporter [Salipiger abyssi]MBN9886362.1 DMT family transporter [Salipiger abyssi]
MSQDRIVLIATVIVALSGVLWGVYWLPVRAMVARGLPGAWGTVFATGVATLVLGPLVLPRWRDLIRAGPVALCAIAIAGAAFTLYSIGLVYGRVAIIILLYFLTPVWSTLIGRYVMGWHTPVLRIAAVGLGLLGLVVMLSAGGEAPLPRGAGEWMALISGLMWSLGTTGIRARSTLGPLPASFVFAAGATVTGLTLAPVFDPWPEGLSPWADPVLIGLALGTGVVWWGLSLVLLMWATLRLDPARVGILLQAEVLVGALSAALLAGEHLHPLEIAGGALVVAAGLLEVWPVRRRARVE